MQIKEISEMLKRYCSLPALSGYEQKMAYAMRDDLTEYCDRVEIDKPGNVIGTIDGTDPEAPSVMLLAHIDSIGFMVKRILPSGLMTLERVGGSADKVLQGAGMLIGNEQGEYYEACIGTQSYSSNTMKDRVTVNPLSELTLDIGALSEGEVKTLGIGIGSPVVYRPMYLPMGANDRVIATFLDNRAGCAALIVAASMLKENRPKATVHIVGTVMEEFNLRGGVIAERKCGDEIAICVGPALSTDTPDTKRQGNTKLGGGPVATMFNFHGRGTLNGCIPQLGLVKLAVRTAEEAGISLQRSAGRGILSETAYIQLEGEGVCCIDIGIPVRYTHAPSEVADLKDISDTGKLVFGMIKSIDKSYYLNRF